VIDLYDLRAGLMRLAGVLVSQRATAAQIQAFLGLVDAMEAARAQADSQRFQELNVEFHNALVEATDNRRLQDIYNGLGKESRLFRRRGLVSAGAMESSYREHRASGDAIASHDATLAGATMENHILQGKARFLAAAADEVEE
jgi:DNA-binding GntR family transcriptional regulator